MILRDLRKVGPDTAAQDIPDIQERIRMNGLIADLKVFQPKASVVSFVER
jgi:hypothetical protein